LKSHLEFELFRSGATNMIFEVPERWRAFRPFQLRWSGWSLQNSIIGMLSGSNSHPHISLILTQSLKLLIIVFLSSVGLDFF